MSNNSNVNHLITDNIDLWTSAIKKRNATGRGSNTALSGLKGIELTGIKKLRELILELAVRGKLVPQDANDEPAGVLLARIAKEKAQLIADKNLSNKRQKQKPLPEITEEEKPFELPIGWEWCHLQDVSSYIQRGKGPKYDDNGSVRVISQKCIQLTGFTVKPARYVNDESLEKYQEERFLQSRDLLWNSTGTGTVGRINLIDYIEEKSLVADSHVTVIRTMFLDAGFIKSVISAPIVQRRMQPGYDNSLVSGSTNQVELNTSSVMSLEVPLPPLAEQHRIVAKVDELMALCDQLEQQTEHSLSAHKTLVEVLLAALIQSKNNAEFQQSWQQLNEHFDLLFTTEASIEQLKQTILQLAVMGKLVPQNQNDEPASVLLEKIAKEKARLIADKKIKKQKLLPEITDEKKPFELPRGWEWARLPEIGELARGKSKHRPRNDPKLYSDGNIKLIQTGDVARSNGIIETYTAFYNETGLAQSRLWLKGTMCITIAANIADTGILGFDACFPDSVVGFVPFINEIDVKYFDYFIRTAKSNLEAYAPSTAQKNINLEILGQLLVPLPPLNELNNIVAKVDELMALCEQLKTRLSDAQTTQLHLADAVVENALSTNKAIACTIK